MEYFRRTYWDTRYTNDNDPFDWYCKYSSLRPHFHRLLTPRSKILNAGCGSSTLSEEMWKDGYKNQVNIDISGVVIDQMIERTEAAILSSTPEQSPADDLQEQVQTPHPKGAHPTMTFEVMDSTNLEFQDESFDAVIDKGLIDTLLCYPTSEDTVTAFLTGVARVLRPGGKLFCVSVGTPSERLMILDNQDYSWKVESFAVKKPRISEKDSVGEEGEPTSSYWLYVCTSGGSENEG